MKRFFADPSQIEGQQIHIVGPDVEHIRHVLRMRPGDELWVSDGQSREYHCEIHRISPEEVVLQILYVQEPDYELPSKIYLFQGLPKGDKMAVGSESTCGL